MSEGLERVAGPTTARDIESLAGNLLRRARKARGLGLSEVAAAAEVPVETVAGIEAGEVQPSLPELFLILIRSARSCASASKTSTTTTGCSMSGRLAFRRGSGRWRSIATGCSTT